MVEYGQSVTYGSWVCSSEETGMTCRNTETGHGVFLSSARYETFLAGTDRFQPCAFAPARSRGESVRPESVSRIRRRTGRYARE